jgi:hypothetical protein
MNTISPNYPSDTINKMTEIMSDGTTSTVEKITSIMDFTGKSKRSVVAKLTTMGLYKAAARKKVGKKVTKATLVSIIGFELKGKFPSLTKATTEDLHSLLKAIKGV